MADVPIEYAVLSNQQDVGDIDFTALKVGDVACVLLQGPQL